ncbi:MAG: adenine phosphoribosyltransferase [Flavobacteriales bacterium]|nr:MAG: adenine phosphoribosyltransferase [Flavobacteriales bacterium]
MISNRLKNAIRDVPDFPKPGIIFKDITPILLDPQLTRNIVDEMANHVKLLNLDAIVGIESRGFWFGIMLANKLNIPFIPIRKKGKLPYKTVSYSYNLEYGSAEIEMHKDEIKKDWNVLIHDDLLATGGTACAAAELIKMQNANVAGFSFVVDLTFLNGSETLKKYSKNIFNLVGY